MHLYLAAGGTFEGHYATGQPSIKGLAHVRRICQREAVAIHQKCTYLFYVQPWVILTMSPAIVLWGGRAAY
jgi:hypothetical protein